MAAPAKQQSSRWGSFLSQAVAGVEARLDTILADADDVSGQQQPGPKPASMPAQTPAQTPAPSSKPSPSAFPQQPVTHVAVQLTGLVPYSSVEDSFHHPRQ